MKVIIPTIGTRGDVQPYINLAQGLCDAGHDVFLANNLTLYPLVEQHGIRSVPVSQPVDMGMDTKILSFLVFFFGVWGGIETRRYLEFHLDKRLE